MIVWAVFIISHGKETLKLRMFETRRQQQEVVGEKFQQEEKQR